MQIFKVHRSKWFLIWPLALISVMCVSLIIAIWVLGEIDPAYSAMLSVIILIAFLVANFIVWADWNSTIYILTDHTIEKVGGFITRTKTYISLHDLSRIQCKTGILGEVFNYGTISIESETAETPFELSGVHAPSEVMDLIRQARAHASGPTDQG